MKPNEDEAKKQDEEKQDELIKRSPWEPIELSLVGDIKKVVQVDSVTPPPDLM